MSNKMTIDQAIRILDPATSKAEIEKIRASIITNNDEDRYYATIAKVEEACELACDIMRKYKNLEELSNVSLELPDYFDKEKIHEMTDMWQKFDRRRNCRTYEDVRIEVRSMILHFPFDSYELYVQDHSLGGIDPETYKKIFGEMTVPTDEEVDSYFE